MNKNSIPCSLGTNNKSKQGSKKIHLLKVTSYGRISTFNDKCLLCEYEVEFANVKM